MTKPVIQVHDLGKRFRIGTLRRHSTLGEVIASAAKVPFRRETNGASGNGGHNGTPDDILWALRHVSFDVRQGEVVGFIGRNGAGKSTLLKILARITRPTEGWAEVRGRVGSLLEVGTGFHPQLTGRENVYLSGAILGMRKAEIARKFDEIVAFAEVERFLDTQLKHYSSGMQMRLAFAVAAHLEPEILFVDEVLAVGDAAFQKKCLGKMSDVARQGRTILFVSHNMAAVRKLCARVVWLEGGRVTKDGDSVDVIDTYLQKNTGTNLESVWEDPQTAPGDHRTRLRSVRVIPQNEPDEPVSVHTPLKIEFTYWNYVPGAVLSVSMHLFNHDEICIFCSESDFVPRPAGLIRHTVTIPGDFLNSGSYYVNLIVAQDASVGILFQNNAVSFQVAEGKIVGNWYGKFPGTTRPQLKWESGPVQSEQSAAIIAASCRNA